MAPYIRGPLLYTWLLLVTATVFSWWLGMRFDAAPHQRTNLTVTIAILLIAIIKCRLVISHYMEVRLAPAWLQWTCDGWLMLNFGMVSAFYWFVL